MNKQLMPDEVALLAKPAMTRREKLLRFAEIVRSRSVNFSLFDGLERYSPEQLQLSGTAGTAFEAAAADPILRDAGLTGNTVADAMKFFELSQHELHEFSCYCGGAIANSDMANRIERIAG
jgi:hypothetical protein